MKFHEFIFRATNEAVDIEVEPAEKPEVWGGYKRITISLSAPLFLRRLTCRHAHAIAKALHMNGSAYCLRCKTRVLVMPQTFAQGRN